MKILVIAYEFPPSPSPQALRWAYLSRELVFRGHDVHVLTADLGPGAEVMHPSLPAALSVHRTYPGPLRGLVACWRKLRHPHTAVAAESDRGQPAPTPAPKNARWRRGPLKTRLIQAAYRLSGLLWFPDVRGEWRIFGIRAARRLLEDVDFDVVITSHEPATSIEIALAAMVGSRARWVADLGDPVLAPYTPRRWRSRSFSVEQATCREADAVIVTASAAARMLAARHQGCRPKILTQGFEIRPSPSTPPADGPLELAYAGRFYNFRRAENLFAAVAMTKGVRLSVATAALPDSLRAIAERHPDSFRLLGFIDHREALELQATSHVLVNIPNRNADQVPGKLYEYLGACRPILHLSHGEEDPGADLVRDLNRGWIVHDSESALSEELTRLRQRFAEGKLHSGLELSLEAVMDYSWSSIGKQLDELVRSLPDPR